MKKQVDSNPGRRTDRASKRLGKLAGEILEAILHRKKKPQIRIVRKKRGSGWSDDGLATLPVTFRR